MRNNQLDLFSMELPATGNLWEMNEFLKDSLGISPFSSARLDKEAALAAFAMQKGLTAEEVKEIKRLRPSCIEWDCMDNSALLFLLAEVETSKLPEPYARNAKAAYDIVERSYTKGTDEYGWFRYELDEMPFVLIPASPFARTFIKDGLAESRAFPAFLLAENKKEFAGIVKKIHDVSSARVVYLKAAEAHRVYRLNPVLFSKLPNIDGVIASHIAGMEDDEIRHWTDVRRLKNDAYKMPRYLGSFECRQIFEYELYGGKNIPAGYCSIDMKAGRNKIKKELEAFMRKEGFHVL